MTITSDPSTITVPNIALAGSVQLAAAAPSLWRVVSAGRIIGHLQALVDDAGVRYRARRFHAGSRAFRDLGDFWSAADAIECLRFAR